MEAVCATPAERLVMQRAPTLQRPGSIIMNYPTAVGVNGSRLKRFSLFRADIRAVKMNCQ